MTYLLADRIFLFLGFILGVVSIFLPWMKVNIKIKLKTNVEIKDEASYTLFSPDLKTIAELGGHSDLYNTTIAFIILTLICIVSSTVLSMFPMQHNFLLMKFSLALGFIFPVIAVIVWYNSKVSEGQKLIMDNSEEIQYKLGIPNASRFEGESDLKATAGPLLFVGAEICCFIAFVIGMSVKSP